MWYIAFTLGLFGSLHCIGMCGPLALTFCTKPEYNILQSLNRGILYNLGRTTTYTVMGLVFGLMGSLLIITDLQKFVSISLGCIIILSFFFSINLDHKIQNLSVIKSINNSVRKLINYVLLKGKKSHPLTIGVVNGLLPCGLVYIALAGALTAGSVTNGMIFMALFGLGTIPALLSLTLGSQYVGRKVRAKLRSIIPYIQLGFGVFLLYRGIFIDFLNETNI